MGIEPLDFSTRIVKHDLSLIPFLPKVALLLSEVVLCAGRYILYIKRCNGSGGKTKRLRYLRSRLI